MPGGKHILGKKKQQRVFGTAKVGDRGQIVIPKEAREFFGIGIFFVGGFMTMSGAGWGASLFGGGCFSFVFGLICHAVITLRRNDK